MIFLGKRNPGHSPGEGKVYVIDEENMDIHELLPSRSQEVRNFTNGFSWGYRGEGPSQLALALLLETTNDAELSNSLCHSFKEEFFTNLQRTCWAIATDDIEEWINEAKNNVVYVKNAPDDMYHRKGCELLGNDTTRVTLQRVLEYGYKPCPECNPPANVR